MKITIEQLIEKLYQHEADYVSGRSQNFSEVCKDCKDAADIISTLRSSKKTQKRRRQRTSRKNRLQAQKIAELSAELERVRSSSC